MGLCLALWLGITKFTVKISHHQKVHTQKINYIFSYVLSQVSKAAKRELEKSVIP